MKQMLIIFLCVTIALASRTSEWSSSFALKAVVTQSIRRQVNAFPSKRVEFIVVPNYSRSSVVFRVRGLSSSTPSSLRIYNLGGRLVTDLSDQLRTDGQLILWNVVHIPAGIFLAQLQTGSGAMTSKFMVCR
jgi:hypothetical protein